MNRTEKAEVISRVKESWKDVASIVLADCLGVDVPTITSVRREFRGAGCQVKVVKNKLVRVAIGGLPIEPLGDLLKGPITLIWSNESPTTPAKIAVKIAKEKVKFIIRGGFFDGKVLDKQGVEALATMPGKEELQAMLLATFIELPTQFARLLAAAPTNFLYVLQARERALGVSL